MRIHTGRMVAMWVAVAGLLLSGCASAPVTQRLVRYRPKVTDRMLPRPPAEVVSDSGAVVGPASGGAAATETDAGRVLQRGDNVMIRLLDIRESVEIADVVDDLGGVTLPLLGTVRIMGKTTAEAEALIKRAYIDGQFYRKISVIVLAQQGEYYVRGEVKREGKYALSGDLTLSQAIATAGGYTEYANRKKIQANRGKEVLYFNMNLIDEGKAKDPLIQPGDSIIVHRRWL